MNYFDLRTVAKAILGLTVRQQVVLVATQRYLARRTPIFPALAGATSERLNWRGGRGADLITEYGLARSRAESNGRCRIMMPWRACPKVHALLPLSLVLLAALGTGCATPVLTVYDTAIRENGSARLLAALETQKGHLNRDPIAGRRVEYFISGQRVGEAVTSAAGEADLIVDLRSKSATTYEVEAHVDGLKLSGKGMMFSRTPHRVGIVLDIDDTISRTRFWDLLRGRRDELSKPLQGAVEVLSRLARDHEIAYVTARPRVLFESTREWLVRNGFPRGPLIVSGGMREAMRAAEYKSRVIARARQSFPDVLIGIGDKASDAAAYSGNGMLTIIIGRASGDGFDDSALVLGDWHTLELFFQANHALLTDPERIRRVVDEGGLQRASLVPWKQSEAEGKKPPDEP